MNTLYWKESSGCIKWWSKDVWRAPSMVSLKTLALNQHKRDHRGSCADSVSQFLTWHQPSATPIHMAKLWAVHAMFCFEKSTVVSLILQFSLVLNQFSVSHCCTWTQEGFFCKNCVVLFCTLIGYCFISRITIFTSRGFVRMVLHKRFASCQLRFQFKIWKLASGRSENIVNIILNSRGLCWNMYDLCSLLKSDYNIRFRS